MAMAERLILALCFLFPGPAGAAGLAAVWLCVMFFLRRKRLFEQRQGSFINRVVTVQGFADSRMIPVDGDRSHSDYAGIGAHRELRGWPGDMSCDPS